MPPRPNRAARRMAREHIRYQHATHRLTQHADTAAELADTSGKAGIVIALLGFAWMIARCAPTLLPGLFP